MSPQPAADRPDFSAVVTCYFEERSIDEFFGRLDAAMKSLGRSYEIIMVNDGSTDDTWPKLKAIWENNPQVRVVMDFFGNAGQQAAVTACLCEARGDAVILMDSDLQLFPEEIPLLVEQYDRGFDVVSGYRKERRDSFWRIAPSKLANVIMRRSSRSNLRDFGCTFKIFNARLPRAFELGPYHLFSVVDTIAKTARCKDVPVSHSARKYGKSGWTVAKLWKYNMDNIVSLSERPFQGLAITCLALALLFVLRVLAGFVTPFFFLSTVSNGLLLNAIALSILINIGLICMVGEFTIRNFLISRRVPLYIIREKLERQA